MQLAGLADYNWPIKLKCDWPGRIVAGGYPEVFQREPARARQWQAQCIQSIIDRDIDDISQVRDGDGIARLIEYLSHQTAQRP